MFNQVSRDHNLKIPKKIEITMKNPNSISDVVATKEALAIATNSQFNLNKEIICAKEQDDALKLISKIPTNANDLMVITVVKKLGAYIITVTEKSPKRFRGVFVNRMQNYCLEVLECLLNANFIRMDSLEHKTIREKYQKDAIIKLKLLGYIAMVAEMSGCILIKQYKQISMQITEAVNLTAAWKKSDDERWRKRN